MASERTIRRRQLGELDKIGQSQQQFGGLQLSFLQQALQAITQGGDLARREASAAGAASRQSALDQGTQVAARAEQRGQDQGFYGSQQQNVQRGIAADTQRRLQEIDQGLAGLYANIAQSTAQQQAGVLGSISDFYGLRSAQETERRQGRQEALKLTKSSDLQKYGGLVADLGGTFAGAMFGTSGFGSLGGLGGGGGGSGPTGFAPPPGMNLNTFV